MKIIAHRGASGIEPENTLRAISAALTMKVTDIEIDVHKLVDGEQQHLVVIHNRSVNKTTNAKGKLSQFTLAQLQQLDAGKGEHIPTLMEVITLINGRCNLHIELKGDNTIELLLPQLAHAIANLNFCAEQFIISSFNHRLLAQIKKLAPEYKTAALIAHIPLDLAECASKLQAMSLNADIDFIDQALIDDAHQRGLEVLVYTVDDPDDIAQMLALGVDGIFSNYPDRAQHIVNELTNF